MTILPYDHQAEADTIGCMVTNPAHLITGIKTLTENDYTSEPLRIMYTTMREMFNEQQPVDETTLAARLHTAHRVILRDVVEGAEDATLFDEYTSILKDRTLRRQLREAASSIITNSVTLPDATRVLHTLEESAFTIRSQHNGKTRETRSTTLDLSDWMGEYLDDSYEDTDERVYDHCLPALQEVLGPANRGELHIIAGYSGDGKSVYALQQLASIHLPVCGSAGSHDNSHGGETHVHNPDGDATEPIASTNESLGTGTRQSVGYYSLEMPARQIMRRLAAHTGIPLKTIKQRSWTQYQRRILADYARTIAEWPLDIHAGSCTVESIRADQMKYDYDIIFIDHIHRMPGSSDRLSLEEMIRGFKTLALDANCLVVVLAQLSRRDGYPRPSTNQLRGSEMLTAEADNVLFVYRKRDEETGLRTLDSEIVVGKARDGESDVIIPCSLVPNSMMFYEPGTERTMRMDRTTLATTQTTIRV